MANLRVKQSAQGFTLIEILIVTLMMGILASLASPSLLAFVERSKVNRAFANLSTALEATQQEAVKRSQSCTLQLPTNNSENGVLNSSCLTTGADALENVKITYNGSGTINFNYRGNTNSQSTMVIYSEATNFKRCIVISTGIGMIRKGTYESNHLTSISATACRTTA